MEYGNGKSDGPSRDLQSGFHPAGLDTSLSAELNTFFPFDPYMLPKSQSYIHGVYRDWASVAIDDDEEDEDEEDEDPSVREEHRPPHYLDISRPDVGKGLAASFDSMSISPAR
jgi:RNA polymerase I-specific transcription initiation factor RRN3